MSKKTVEKGKVVPFSKKETELFVNNNNEIDVPGASTEQVELILSLHSSWDEELSEEEKYKLQFIHSEISTATKGKASFFGYAAEYQLDELHISFFIRNATDQPLKVKNVPFMIVNHGNQIIASDRFNLEEAGEVPAFSSRPWKVVFSGEKLFSKKETFEDWGIKLKHFTPPETVPNYLDISNSWLKSMNKKQLKHLINVANALPPIPIGRIQLVPIDFKWTVDKELVVTILIRNGLEKGIKLGQTPIILSEIDKGPIATSIFNLTGLTVKAGSSKPWNFLFPKDSLDRRDFDIEKLEVSSPLRLNKE